MEDEYFGRMNDPTSSAVVTGPCGDSMEIYLVIKHDVIEDVRYYTDGCDETRKFGRAAAARVYGKAVVDALGVSAGELMRAVPVEDDHRHCAILAVTTLYRAIADYMLKP